MNIKLGINKTSKLALYKTRKENIKLNINTYLRGTMTPGKRLKLKLRSGTHALGNELKRWSSRNNNGCCKCCASDKLEDVIHFVSQCSKFSGNRKDFLKNLLDLFPADDVVDRSFIKNCFVDKFQFLKLVLSSDFSFLQIIPDKIHSNCHSFLLQIYATGSKLIFSPLSSDVHVTTKTFFSHLCRNAGSERERERESQYQ